MQVENQALQQAMRRELARSIVVAMRRGRLTLVDELIGYSLFAGKIANAYSVKLNKLPESRRILSPEILTGLLRNDVI